MDDLFYMRRALELAARGAGRTSPNPVVGAVIVQQGKIVGEGWHQAAGLPHAEVNAINDAKGNCSEGTIYVTLEPCNHTGKTPPCAKAILDAGLSKVVVAMKDPNPSVKGGGIEFLRANGVEVVVGVLESEAQRQNEIFIKYVKTGMPFVMVKCAATLDGRIATRSGDSKWVSSEASRQFVHQLRDQVDGILVGKNTVLLDNPSLTTRLPGKDGKDPHRIILDTHLDIPETSALLHLDSTAETFIFTGPEIANEKRSRLEKSGARILTSPLADGRVDLVSVMKTLGELGITSVLVEGGSRIIGAAFSSGLVDKLYFFYSPKILGGNDGVPITWGKGKGQMRDCLNVTDIQLRRFENDILIEGYVNG